MAIILIPLIAIFGFFAYYFWRFIASTTRAIFGKKPGQRPVRRRRERAR